MTAPVIYHVTGKGEATSPSLPGIGFGGLLDSSSSPILLAAMEALGADGVSAESWRSVVRLVARTIWVYPHVPLGSAPVEDLKETMRDLVAGGDGPWDSDDELFAATTRILKAHYEANKGKEVAKMAEGEKLWDIMSGGSQSPGYLKLSGTIDTVPGYCPTVSQETWAQISDAMRSRYGISHERRSLYYERMNAAIMRARLRGFTWRNYKTATEADHLEAIKQEWDAIGVTEAQVRMALEWAVKDLMVKFRIGPGFEYINKQTTNVEAQVTNKTTASTGEMLKRNIKQAGVNTAIIKVNQGLTEIMVRNLKEKIPQIDTAEGRAILQTLTPVLLHFAATSFPEHVPKAESVTGYVDKAAELALTTGGVMLADKAQEMLTPIAMEMFNHIQESVAAMPKVIRDELTTGPTQEEKEMKVKQQAAMAQEKTL